MLYSDYRQLFIVQAFHTTSYFTPHGSRDTAHVHCQFILNCPKCITLYRASAC